MGRGGRRHLELWPARGGAAAWGPAPAEASPRPAPGAAERPLAPAPLPALGPGRRPGASLHPRCRHAAPTAAASPLEWKQPAP